MKLRLSYSKKVFLLLSLPLAFEFLFVSTLAVVLEKAETERKIAAYSRDIYIEGSSVLQNLLFAGETYLLYTQLNDQSALPRYAKQMEAFREHSERLLELLNESSRFRTYRHQVEELFGQVYEGMQLGTATVGLETAQRQALDRTLEDQLKFCGKNLTASLSDLNRNERNLRRKHPAEESRLRKLLATCFVAGLLSSTALVITLGIFFNRSTTRRIYTLVDNTSRLAAGQELLPASSGSDEIWQLDTVFHNMAETLAEASRKERARVESAIDIICSIDSQLRFLQLNPAAATIWGYTADRLAGQPITSILPETETQLVQDAFQAAALKMQENFECTVNKENGQQARMLWSAQWSKEDKCFFCVAHDISLRKLAEDLLRKSEERMRAMVSTMPVGILTVSPEGLVESANPRCLEILECSEENMLAKSLTEWFLSEEQSEKPIPILELILKQASTQSAELKGRKHSGAYFPMQVSISKFADSGGEHYLVNIQDVSQLYEVQRLKQEFLAIITHELRTPLAAINLFITALATGVYGELNQTGQRRVEMLERNTAQLIRLINDLLDSERMAAGQLSIKMLSTNIGEVVENALRDLSDLAARSGVIMQSTVESLLIPADHDRILQVMINLLSNALKYSPRGAMIKVESSRKLDMLLISISDEGSGIAPEYLEMIFEKYRRVPGDAERMPGTGLGLTLCKYIVEAHKGEIGVESQVGKGSRFWFSLPLVADI